MILNSFIDLASSLILYNEDFPCKMPRILDLNCEIPCQCYVMSSTNQLGKIKKNTEATLWLEAYASIISLKSKVMIVTSAMFQC